MKKLILILLIATLFKQVLFGQGGFSKNYFLNNSFVSVCKDVIEAPNGNIIMLGLTTGTTGYNRLTVLGADAQGNQLWRKDYGSDNFEYLDDFAIYSKNIFFTKNFLYCYLPVKDGNNAYFSALLKFNYNGDTLWQKKYYSSSEYLYINDFMLTNDNGFLMTGEIQDPNNPIINTLILKTDSFGNELWRKRLSKTALPNAQAGEKIMQDSLSKKIIIAGYQYNGNASSYTGFANIIITDSLGIEIQRRTYSGSCGGYFRDAFLTKDKKIVAAGYNDQCNNLGGPGGSNRYKSHVVKVDLNNINNVLWSKQFDTLSVYNSFTTINELRNGDIILAGIVDTLLNYNIPDKGMLRLIKLDKNGNTIWNKKFSRDNIEKNAKWPRSLTLTNDGGFLIANELHHATNPRPYSITKIDSIFCDSTVAYCSTVGLEELSYLNEVVRVYPNPAALVINVEFLVFNANNYTIKITNTLGQVVQTNNIKHQTTTLNISALQTGIYFFQVFDKNKLIGTTKIIKE